MMSVSTAMTAMVTRAETGRTGVGMLKRLVVTVANHPMTAAMAAMSTRTTGRIAFMAAPLPPVAGTPATSPKPSKRRMSGMSAATAASSPPTLWPFSVACGSSKDHGRARKRAQLPADGGE